MQVRLATAVLVACVGIIYHRYFHLQLLYLREVENIIVNYARRRLQIVIKRACIGLLVPVFAASDDIGNIIVYALKNRRHAKIINRSNYMQLYSAHTLNYTTVVCTITKIKKCTSPHGDDDR